MLLQVTRSKTCGMTGVGPSLFGVAQQPGQLQKRIDVKCTNGYAMSHKSRAPLIGADWRPGPNIVNGKKDLAASTSNAGQQAKVSSIYKPVELRQSRT